MGMTEQMAKDVLEDVISVIGKGKQALKDAFDIAMNALEEIQQYRAIGTVEELQALKEKATPKEPIAKEHSFDWFGTKQVRTNYFCPCCKKRVEHDFCTCGQRIDWRKVDGEH